MLKKEANKITGGLSAPGKMPEGSYNLPASACQTGAKLRLVPETPCHGCYAFKFRYNFKPVKKALARRLKSLDHPQWVEAMTTLVKKKKHFRWHDSGDLQGVQHLKNILEVVKATPDARHWLPTREHSLIRLMDPNIIPTNLIIRLSATKVNGAAPGWWPWTATVSTTTKTCPAPDQGGKCRDCRSCWSRDIQNVVYAKH